MTKLEDWEKCNELYCSWMYWEAVESRYNAKAAYEAQKPYLKAFTEYQEKYGVMFNPEVKPETTILEDAAELRDLSAAFLADIEKDNAERKAYSQKITETFDRWREQARQREGVEA